MFNLFCTDFCVIVVICSVPVVFWFCYLFLKWCLYVLLLGCGFLGYSVSLCPYVCTVVVHVQTPLRKDIRRLHVENKLS